MIFVTVGAQMPFDRLIRAVDGWAARTGRRDVFAQIGVTRLRPRSIEWAAFLGAEEFYEKVRAARVLVAHAGMGSIITALEAEKPILVMPRRGDLRETRNDHQVATALRFREVGGIAVAMDEQELARWLDRIDRIPAPARAGAGASESLLAALREFVRAVPPGRPSRRRRG